MIYVKPPVIKEGDVVGIAAASSPFRRDLFDKGVAVLKELGLQPGFDPDITEETGYLAGSDERRAAELNGLFADPEIKAIFFARGGYGVQRIIPLLDTEAIKHRPKIVVGSSDLTALHSYLQSHFGIISLYGPVVTGLGQEDRWTQIALQRALVHREPLGVIEEADNLLVIKEGEGEGIFKGGCISLVTSSIGTAYDLDTDGAVLFLEDINEKLYVYDRMLTQLKNSGKLRRVQAIIFGSLGLSSAERHPEKIWSMLEELLHDFPGPILAKFPAGHCRPSVTVPLGVKCRVTTSPAKIEFIEAAVN